jgi:hypothetical protein
MEKDSAWGGASCSCYVSPFVQMLILLHAKGVFLLLWAWEMAGALVFFHCLAAVLPSFCAIVFNVVVFPIFDFVVFVMATLSINLNWAGNHMGFFSHEG